MSDSFNVDMTGMAEVHAALLGIKNAYPVVVSRSINKTETGVRTDAVAEIYKELNLTKTRIRKDFSMQKATIRALRGSVIAEGKPVNLGSFSGTRQTKKGITVKVWRSGTRQLYKHGFLGKMRSKTGTYTAAFWRTYSGARTKRAPGYIPGGGGRDYRNPIESLEGPRVEDVYERPAVMGAVLRAMDVRMEKNLDHELTYFMSRL